MSDRKLPAVSEHFIFTGLDKTPFLKNRTSYDRGDVSRENFDQYMALDNLIEAELSLAKASFENCVHHFDPKIHSTLFLEGRLLEYVAADENPFRALVMSGKFNPQIKAMFEGTESQALDGLKNLSAVLSKIKVYINSKGDELKKG